MKSGNFVLQINKQYSSAIQMCELFYITSYIQFFSFLCVHLSGLAVGDVPGNQPIGIVLTVLGVVVLDFCADASEGPIRAYLLDVADTEEQDMALNIHAFSAGDVHEQWDANSLVCGCLDIQIKFY